MAQSNKQQQIIDLVEQFNRKVKMLSSTILNQDKDDILLQRINTAIYGVCKYNPVQVMDIVGKNMYKYKEQIYNSDTEFGLSHDFLQDCPDNIQEIKHVMDKIRSMWATKLNEETRCIFINLIQDMLDDYIEYLSLRIL
jgi:predicted Zn-dependent protease